MCLSNVHLPNLTELILHSFFYRKDLEAWELKMISVGRSDLVRSRPVREKKPKAITKKQ